MQLLAREDAHTRLFDIYAQVVQVLATGQEALLQAALRAFELLLLREIGLLPRLDQQTLTLAPLEPDTLYVLVPEGGLRTAHADERQALSGLRWGDLEQALVDGAPLTETLRVCALLSQELKPQIRTLLHYHCGVSTLRTRQVMVELQSL